MTIHAYETLDCASKVRIHYLLAQPLSARVLSLFPADSIEIQAFSQMVAGAKDHVTIRLGDSVRATGVLGETKLVVTYGKVRGDRPETEINHFESLLCGLDGDMIERQSCRQGVV